MNERWRKVAVPIGVEEGSKSLIHAGIRWDFQKYILTHDDIERVRLGYVCIHCLSPHEHNHPQRCKICTFPMREIQDDVFEVLYEGEEQVGPRTTLAEEMEIAKEIVERGSR